MIGSIGSIGSNLPGSSQDPGSPTGFPVGNWTPGALLFPGPFGDRRPATVPHGHGLAAHAAPGSLGEASVTVELHHARGCHGGRISESYGRKMQKGAKGVDSSALMIIHIYQLLNPFSSQKGAYETGELKEC